MSTNHTPNFNLCQWEADDKVLRADFNDDNQKIDAALAGLQQSMGNCRIVTGSYVGTGKYGPSNRNTLTFDGKPLAVFIMAQAHSSNTWAAFLPMIRGTQWASASTPCTVTWSENGVSWYHDDSAQYQLSRGTNFYIALLEANV